MGYVCVFLGCVFDCVYVCWAYLGFGLLLSFDWLVIWIGGRPCDFSLMWVWF